MNKSNLIKFTLFLGLNFLGLYLGSLFTTQGVQSQWYAELNKSPITPPGWFFGFAWTTIMVCFAFYMTAAFRTTLNKQKLILLFALQWLLNFLWNPLFFSMHQVAIGLIVIISLALTVSYFLFSYNKVMKWKSILLLPYFLWIYVASYLNLYILLNN
jgi:tryptophan-rich sensory protein